MKHDIEAAFSNIPDQQRTALLALRERILERATALELPSIEGSLKWGQPAYRAKGGTTLRLGCVKSGEAALFVPCSTDLIDRAWEAVPALRFEGSRAIVVPPAPPELDLIIDWALTYHSARKLRPHSSPSTISTQ